LECRDNKTVNSDRPSPLVLLAEQINDALPQTQCTRCAYPSCRAYADAIAQGAAPINQCPPGGQEGIERLAAITGQPALALNPANGQQGPRSVAVVDEDWCIGCTLCLDACPTDAILGGNKMMHTVIEPYCTGCELCIPVCPVDCINLENASGERIGWSAWSAEQASVARTRYEIHSYRRSIDGHDGNETPEKSIVGAAQQPQPADTTPSADRKRSLIEAALASARAKAKAQQ
jgi:electron transport complex protein RnfB